MPKLTEHVDIPVGHTRTEIQVQESASVPTLDLRKPHVMHQEPNKIPTYDQNGHLYSALSLEPIDHTDEAMKETHAIHAKGPQTGRVNEQDRIKSALASMRATGQVDADTMAKFESLLLESAKPAEVSEE